VGRSSSWQSGTALVRINVPTFVNGVKKYMLQIPITFGSISATSYTIEISGLQPEIIPQQSGELPSLKLWPMG